MATASLDNVCGLSNLSCRPGQDVYVALAANGSAIDVMMIVIAIVMASTAWCLPMDEEYQREYPGVVRGQLQLHWQACQQESPIIAALHQWCYDFPPSTAQAVQR